MQIKSTIFVKKVLNKLKLFANCSNDTELSEVLKVSRSTLSTWKSRGSLDFSVVVDFAKNNGINLNWLFIDDDLPPKLKDQKKIYRVVSEINEEYATEFEKMTTNIERLEKLVTENNKLRAQIELLKDMVKK